MTISSHDSLHCLATHTEGGRRCPAVPPGAKPYTCEYPLSSSCAITYSITLSPTVSTAEDALEEEQGKRPEEGKKAEKGRDKEKITGHLFLETLCVPLCSMRDLFLQ